MKPAHDCAAAPHKSASACYLCRCLEAGVLVLTLAIVHDRRLARDLYPVCQALAGSVVEGCSLVTCSSVDDTAALLASHRWVCGGSKTVTALRVTASTGHVLKREPATTAGANPLYVWLNSAEQLGDEDVDVLFSLAPKCPELRVLSVHDAISDDAKDEVEYLLQPLIDAAPHWPRLQHVALCRTTLGPDLGQALAACAQHWPALQHLDLVQNDLGPYGAEALAAAAQHWSCLQFLSLADNNIAVKGAMALATGGQQWPTLQELNLAYNELGDEGIEVLAGAGEHWKHLQSLDLCYNDLAHNRIGAEPIGTAAHWRSTLVEAVPHWKACILV